MDPFRNPRSLTRAGRDEIPLEQVAGRAAVVEHEPWAALVEPGGEVLGPELVGLEHVPVDVDHLMICHGSRSVPIRAPPAPKMFSP